MHMFRPGKDKYRENREQWDLTGKNNKTKQFCDSDTIQRI